MYWFYNGVQFFFFWIFFFVCVITVCHSDTGIKSILFGLKVNIVNASGGKNFKFSIAFKSAEKNKIEMNKKLLFLRKNGFQQNWFWCLV